jgi:membrane fusion protein, multidrug efflux system
VRRGTAVIIAFGSAATIAFSCAALAMVVRAGHSATHAGKPSEPVAQSSPAVPVVAEPVKSGDVPIYLRGIGTVQAYNTVTVRSQITGQITQIDFKEGQLVHAGDLLAQIDPRPYQTQLDQAIANRARDQAQLANAQQVLQRDLPLLSKNFVAQETIETEKDQVAQLTAAVQADEAQIESARVELSYAQLTSPIDGVTGIRGIDMGNIIHPTDANGLVVVTQLQPISTIFTLPETDLPQIQEAMAKGQVTVLAYSQDNKAVLDRGTLGVVDNQIVQTSGTMRLKADFPNPAHRLWPGELINVRVLIETRADALTVPAPAVQQGPHGPYGYVVKADGTVESRTVSVVQLGNLRAVIGSGLKPGEEVVIDGQSRIQSGSRVTILQGDAASKALASDAEQPEIP